MQIARQFPGPSVNILITGAYGFIGRNCAAALEKDGHSVIRGGRGPRQIGHAPCGHLEIDFAQDFDPQVWKSRLEGVDLVLNTVGAMAPSRSASLGDLHARAPIALFDACAQLGIRAINISALGADEGAQSEFHRTKKAADDHLLSLQPNAAVVLPSLVYGPGGASAQLFDTLASLPLIALPAGGNQQVQPVHIDDLVELVTILSARPVQGGRIPAVGPAPLALREFIGELRHSMGLGPARIVPVPRPVASAAVRLAALTGARWADPSTLGMLERGNTADAAPIRALLGREPRGVAQFLPGHAREGARVTAQLAWLLPLLRVSIAVVWLAAAVVSVGPYPVEQSVALVERTGIRGVAALALVYIGAAVDAFFGLATLFMRRRRILWIAQLAVIAGYTAILTLWLPEFWLHPFGPLVKNFPMLAAIYMLYELERSRPQG